MALDSRSQELPWRAAPIVWARGWPWVTCGVTEHGPVACLHVAPAAEDAPDLGALLVPIDRVSAGPPARRARRASRHWLRQWVAAWPAVAWPSVEVAAPVDAPLAILAHQLAPVLAVVRGEGTRLLIADPVGQGKTIEAGLLIRELAARGAAARVLILTPATLRDQWRRELTTRCRIEADVLDRAALRRRSLDDPQGAGPFRRPGVSICSSDLAKQADVLASLAAQAWDVLVVDEAHTVAGDSSRTAAVRAIGERSRVIALLTATPHSGDPDQFGRLCSIGALGSPPPLWFRRPRPATRRGGGPRALDVQVGRSPSERSLAIALRRYLRRLDATRTPGGRLVAVVLRKRALSSPAALAASLRHRIAWLEGQAPARQQPALPFDLDEASDADARQPAALAEPGLVDPATEREVARAALRLAEAAIGSWSKRRVLERLLRRTRERVLVFTEYRDTLEAVAGGLARVAPVAVLHGGLDRGDRERAIDRFAAGGARVLVATDVAAEGLNMQSACRLVVHVELPWSPVRIEQRNGRVDRLGQSRRVHVWRLLGEAAHEAQVLAALAARVARMRADGVEVSTTGLPATVQSEEGPVTTPPGVVLPHAGEAASIAAARAAELLRALLRASSPRRPGAGLRARRGLPWRRVRPRLSGLPRGVTIVCLAPSCGMGSRPALLPIHVALRSTPPGPPEEWLPRIAAVAAASVPARREPLVESLRARETAMLARARDDRRRLDGRWQASLFERRAARIVSAARDRAEQLVDDHAGRLAVLAAPAPPPVPVLALLVE